MTNIGYFIFSIRAVTLFSTLGESHIFNCACLKHKGIGFASSLKTEELKFRQQTNTPKNFIFFLFIFLLEIVKKKERKVVVKSYHLDFDKL